MRFAFIGFCLSALLVALGCETSGPGAPGRAAKVKSKPESSSPEPVARGRVGYGILATHYDRDSDGIFEEARRGNMIYHDRNGDGVADLTERDTPPARQLQWDEDFDGVLDHSVTSDVGAVHRWIDRRKIAIPAPQIFKEDRIGRLGTCELSSPKHEFWKSILLERL